MEAYGFSPQSVSFAYTIVIAMIGLSGPIGGWLQRKAPAHIIMTVAGIGFGLGMNPGMTAGAILSGAYFGDKMSPLSDTTNLAPAMAGTDVIAHVKAMMLPTAITYVITLIFFGVLASPSTTAARPI